MGDIAKDFVNFKESRHGNDSVHFICGNLDTHCCKYVLNNFGAINILVQFCVPGCTDSIQLIDTGKGCSIRISVGHGLDKWLSV